VVLSTDFLNLTGSIAFGGEQGLLGVAFAPDYAIGRRFFVNFANPAAIPLPRDSGDRRSIRLSPTRVRVSICGGAVPADAHGGVSRPVLLRRFHQGTRLVDRARIDPSTGEAHPTNLVEHTTELGGSALGNISAFGVDADGELYIVGYSSGAIVKVRGRGLPVDFDDDVKADLALFRSSTGPGTSFSRAPTTGPTLRSSGG
jgi:hypothetical protein